MRKMLKGKWLVPVLLLAFVCMASVSQARTISTNHVVVNVNDVDTSYDFDQVKMEVEDGKTKVCICKCLCFRALQLLAIQFDDGVIPRDDIQIYTGWTTDGAEELFVETMGWAHEDLMFMIDATDATQLTIEDACFFFVQKSTGKAWKVQANEHLYPKEFFTYRTLVKTGKATNEQKLFFQNALRAQAVANMESLPLIDRFDIQETAYFGQNGILRVPSLFVDGKEYEIELKIMGRYLQIVNAASVN